jgi:hypothetical protein
LSHVGIFTFRFQRFPKTYKWSNRGQTPFYVNQSAFFILKSRCNQRGLRLFPL